MIWKFGAPNLHVKEENYLLWMIKFENLEFMFRIKESRRGHS